MAAPLPNSLERVYKLGVGLKGIDGAIELLAGLLLLTIPQQVHSILSRLTHELNETQTTHVVATYIAHTNARLVHDSLTMLIVFLLTHGIIKLILVYGLLREILWIYPYALGTLALFLGYQVYVLITAPGIGMAVLAVLDAVIIYLVWREWRYLQTSSA